MAIYENKFEIGDVVWFKHLGNQYSGWYNLANLFGLSELHGCTKSTKCTVKNYTLHTNEHNKVFVYLLEDDEKNNYLVNDEAIKLYNGQDKEKVEQSPKQQYKQRAKWMMNTGSKPDLPDGTLVKAVFDEGGVIAEVDKLRWSIADNIGQTNVVKWKLANDWNKVVDGQAPDIDGDTLVDIKWVDGEIYKDYPMRTVVGWPDIKKWRYAKEKKAK